MVIIAFVLSKPAMVLVNKLDSEYLFEIWYNLKLQKSPLLHVEIESSMGQSGMGIMLKVIA